MKRSVFLVDSTKREEVAQLLNEKGITWSTEARFKWDWRTAFIVLFIEIIIGLVILIITGA